MKTPNTKKEWRELVRRSAVIFALLQPVQNLYAQNPARGIKFERIGIEQGLSQTSVLCIRQDRQGFMWFGTYDGLNKYDGYSFTVYKHDALDSNSLSNNGISSIYEDHLGTLWIGTVYGLNRFDRDKEQFTRFVNDPKNPTSLSHFVVISIHEDRAGTLWIGTYGGGLNRFDRDKEQFARFVNDPKNPNSLSHTLVSSIYEDRAGAFWIGTYGGGLNRFDRDKEQFTRFVNDPKIPHSLSSSIVNSIYEDHTGTLWIGTGDGGLNRFDRDTEQFIHFVNDPKIPHSLSDNVIHSIYEDRAGTLWVGTHNGGLNRFDHDAEQFVHFVNDPKIPHSLSGNNVTSIYKDHAGTLWIGTQGGGLNRFDRDPDSPSKKFNGKSGQFIHFVNDPKIPHSLSSNIVGPIYEDRSGILWLGTAGGLNQVDRDKEQFKRFVPDAENPYSPSNSVNAIYEDRSGILWIGTGGGLNQFDRDKKQFTRFVHDAENPYSLSADNVISIYEDRSGILWIGTWGGLNQFDRDKEQFTRFVHDAEKPHSLSNNFVNAIYEDRSGRLWLGTAGGLNQFDRDTERFMHYTEKEGLSNNTVYSILEDDHGRLWLSTNKGLSCFDPKTATFRNYDVSDGLQSNEFYGGAYHKSKNGEMFFGGVNGFNAFHPDSIKDNPYIPPVVITTFERYNTADAEGIAIAEKGISQKREIVLSYKDNILTFEFAALNYRNTFKNQYAYKLEGFNDNWIQLGTKRDITFTNLDPGEYTLRVKGSNNDGVWNEEGASLKITITPPWWRTRWAYAIYALLVIAGVFATDRFQRRRLLAKERVQAQIREAELHAQTAEAQAKALQAENARKEVELQKAAELKAAYQELDAAHTNLKATQQQLVTQQKLASLGQLTAGIAHEIKNPLNFVNNFAQLSIDLAGELHEELFNDGVSLDTEKRVAIESLLADIQQNAEKINHHGKRADSIVKSMMQHARGSSGQREMVDINRLLDEAVNLTYHGIRANDASFNITIEKDYDETIGKLEVVPQDISRVFLNIVNNAAYAANQKKKDNFDGFSPMLSVATKNLGDKIEIRIRDNGNGIPLDIRDKIFNPFFTTKPTGQGTGLGLSISYDIIAQEHKGEIQVETEEGKFTEFVVRLPRM